MSFWLRSGSLVGLALAVLVIPAEGQKHEELPSVELNKNFKTFVDSYCIKCHGATNNKSEVRLDTLSTSINNPATAQLWRDVLDVLNVGDMPPEQANITPDEKELAEAIGLLTDDLMKARKALAASGGESVTRRLNEIEYIHSIKAVTGVTIGDEWVPDDENGEDFSTLGWYQTFSPAILEVYEQAAEYALRRILIDANAPYEETKINRQHPAEKVLSGRRQSVAKMENNHEKALKVPEGADPTKHGFKNKGDYDRAFPLHRHNAYPQFKHYVENANSATGMLLYNMRGGPIESVRLTGKTDWRGEYVFRARLAAEKGMKPENKYLMLVNNRNGDRRHTRRSEVDLIPVAGTIDDPKEVELRFKPTYGEGGHRLMMINRETGRQGGEQHANTQIVDKGGRVPAYWIEWLEVEGPLYDGTYKNKRGELLLRKQEHEIDESWAADIFRNFARLAFRGGPVSEDFISKLIVVYKQELKIRQTKVEALIKPMATILTSPQFLYLGVEKSHQLGLGLKKKVKLSGYDMAARLSYIFWKEPPSTELLRDADKLLSDHVLMDKTIDQMLNDPRSDRFYKEFFMQWLGFAGYDEISLDQRQYFFFDDIRRYSVKQQPVEFIKHTIKNDLSLANLIDSDYTLVDSVMGRLYNELETTFEKDRGQFVKLNLDETNRHRGGLLGMPIVQIIGSTGARTSPVDRGAWILRKLLNSPPPPPPPNVDQLEIKDKNLTARQLLEKHKSIPQCYSCHKKMDDMGLAMETFDAVGRWAEKKELVVSGRFPDGSEFKDFNDMKKKLRLKKDQMVKSMLESLIAYSLSRESEFTDETYIEEMVKVAQDNGYQFKPILKAFIKHEKFTYK